LRPGGSAIENVRLFEKAARTAEVSEALQQQTATADVLKVISRSAFDLQAVLNTLLHSAVQLCEAEKGVIFQRDEGVYRAAASLGFSPEFEAYARINPFRPGRGSTTSRAALEGRTVHVADVLADPEYTAGGYQERGEYRTALSVPLLREGVPLGVFSLARSVPRPFTTKQIELVETFADQAVIAIENVRLFEEVQARTAEVSEALQQQTATADVLKVISRSAFDLQKVLDTLAESAAHLCQADQAGICRRSGPGFYYASSFGFPPDWVEYNQHRGLEPGRGSIVGRVLLDGSTVQVADVLDDPEYTYLEPQKKAGYRTFLGVPLLRGDEPIGVLVLTRKTVEPFTGKQIELVNTFADQAVIAIENARLFEEVQTRTRELDEALRQQTATADVLKVISRSAFELQTVLDTLVQSAGGAMSSKQDVHLPP
jgi:GAF domain-containing protein